MAVSGTYICDCGEHFHATLSDDEESTCPKCKGASTITQPDSGIDMIRPPNMEDIASIPFI